VRPGRGTEQLVFGRRPTEPFTSPNARRTGLRPARAPRRHLGREPWVGGHGCL